MEVIKIDWIILLVTFFILLFTTIILSLKTDLIKDISTSNPKPFSLSRSQMAFWTVVIASTYVYLLVLHDFDYAKVVMSESAFILLGIGLGTTATARVMDNADQEKLSQGAIGACHQNDPSQGFWKDILSDKNGVSVARYQNVIFTIILGVGFIINTISKEVMINFDENLLILSGVSAAGYLGVKGLENK